MQNPLICIILTRFTQAGPFKGVKMVISLQLGNLHINESTEYHS